MFNKKATFWVIIPLLVLGVLIVPLAWAASRNEYHRTDIGENTAEAAFRVWNSGSGTLIQGFDGTTAGTKVYEVLLSGNICTIREIHGVYAQQILGISEIDNDPPTPASGDGYFYMLSADGEPYFINDTAVRKILTGGTGGTGAPSDAQYWVSAPDGDLSAEVDMSALSAGLVSVSGGTPSTVTSEAGIVALISDLATITQNTDIDNISKLEAIMSGENILTASELNTFSELDTLIADKTLMNEEDDDTDSLAESTTKRYIHIDSSFPGSPVTGELFYHTSYDILFQYADSKWNPIINYGSTLALYVDGSSGSDAAGKGFASGSGATATIQYCWDNCVPRMFGGVITITVAAGTYREAVVCEGKTKRDSSSSVSIIGTWSNQTTGTATSATTTTITKTGAGWSVNAYQGMIVRITAGTNADEERLILSNTSDTLTTIPWDTNCDATSVFSIDDWGTIVSGADAGAPTTPVRGYCLYTHQELAVTAISFQYPTSYCVSHTQSWGRLYVTNCEMMGSNSYGIVASKSLSYFGSCYIHDNSTIGLYVAENAWGDSYWNWIHNNGNDGARYNTQSGANCWGTRFSSNSSDGLNIDTGSFVKFQTAADRKCSFISNTHYGVLAQNLGTGDNTSSQTYSGNGSGTYTPASAPAGYNS